MEKKPGSFNGRSFAVLVSAFSGLGLPVTGICLHISRHGPFTPAQHAWMTAHNVLAGMFVISAGCHVWMNRRAFMNYVKKGVSGMAVLSHEALAAAAVVSLVLLIAVSHAFHVR